MILPRLPNGCCSRLSPKIINEIARQIDLTSRDSIRASFAPLFPAVKVMPSVPLHIVGGYDNWNETVCVIYLFYMVKTLHGGEESMGGVNGPTQSSLGMFNVKDTKPDAKN